MPAAPLRFEALESLPEVRPGDDLVTLVSVALDDAQRRLHDGEVVVFCQKIVSKSENRFVELSGVEPGARALELAAVCCKDPRLVELVLRESTDVVRCAKDVLIVRHRLGFVVANAAIDQSNIEGGGTRALLLPVDPDASAARLRASIHERLGVRVGVLISDSFGRPFRLGVTGTCVGASGLAALSDERGSPDRFGRPLQVTQVAAGDALAAGAVLAMGEAAQGRPVVIVSGVAPELLAGERPARALIRPAEEDLFR